MRADRSHPVRSSARAALTARGVLVVFAFTLAACSSTQRVPGPMWLPDEPGADEAGGAPAAQPVVTVLRHAGPVDVRRPGAPSGYRLSYYDKRARVRAGGAVVVGPGGRAELLWPEDATSIVLFGDGVAIVGDPERDQPLVRFEKLTRVQLLLTPEDRVILPGGAELRGDETRPSGPFRVEHRGERLMRVKNQSKQGARVLYRDAVLELVPGDAVDLPILAAGTGPFDPDPAIARTTIGGLLVETLGSVEPSHDGARLSVRGSGPGEVSTNGVRVRLEAGDEAIFSGLGRARGEPGGGGPNRGE